MSMGFDNAKYIKTQSEQIMKSMNDTFLIGRNRL